MAAGLGAYLLWGVFPLYLKLMSGTPSAEVLAHRVLWSALLLALVILAARRLASLRDIAPRTLLMLLASALCIGANWLLYTWAILNDHVLDSSLGYFISPLFSVLFGTLLLGERLTRPQWAAVALAAAGVAVATIERGALPLVSLGLAVTFASYGLLRNRAPVDPLAGLFVETALLAPIAGFWLWAHGTAFGVTRHTDLLLVGFGVATSVPLMLFGFAARRLRLSTLGVLQYLSPSLVFLLALFVFREPLALARLAAFALIWAGLAVYVADGWRRTRAVSVPAEAR